MKTIWYCVLMCVLTGALSLVPTQEVAQLQAPPNRDKLQAAAAAKEDASARKKVLKAVEGYAKWCASNGANAEARRYLNLAAMLSGKEFGGKEFDKVRDKEDALKADFDTKQTAERKKLLAAGEDLLKVVVDAWKKVAEDFVGESAALWLHYFRDDALLEKHGWAWNAKMGCLMPAEDMDRVDGGELRHAGAWLDAEAIAAHNQKHASFATVKPQTDGRLTLYSELPLERTLRVMHHATRFRVFLLGLVGGEMSLKHPEGTLKIYVAKDRASYEAQGRKLTSSQGVTWRPTFDAGKYLGVIGAKGCPIILSPDIPTAADQNIAADEMMLLNLLQHELVHLICVEGLKHLESARWTTSQEGPPPHHTWSYEGVATWMENFFWSDGALAFEWTLRRHIPLNTELGKNAEGRLGRALAQIDSLPPLSAFVVQTDTEFANGQLNSYAQSCASWVFLYGRDAATRAKLFAFTAKVHCKEANRDSFQEAFKGVDLAKLDADCRAWLKQLEFAD